MAIAVFQSAGVASAGFAQLLNCAGIYRVCDSVEGMGALTRETRVIIDVGHTSSFAGRPCSRWGLAVAWTLRLGKQPYFGPLLLLSFERERDLAGLGGEGEILDVPGVAFLRLPVRPQDLEASIDSLATPSQGIVLSGNRRLLRARARRLLHNTGTVIASPLAGLRTLISLGGGQPVAAELIAVPLNILKHTWPGLEERLREIASGADDLICTARRCTDLVVAVPEHAVRDAVREALSLIRDVIAIGMEEQDLPRGRFERILPKAVQALVHLKTIEKTVRGLEPLIDKSQDGAK